jgi:DNA-binding winged helix-turn-helix (wHTH) protein
MLKSPRLYHFGDFSLELDPPTLRRGFELLKLPQRQMEILCLLIAAGGNPVPKKDFFDHIWRDSFVEEGNLTQTIFLLRRTLGKLPDGGDYIETLPRRGYRLAPAAGLCQNSDLQPRSANPATRRKDHSSQRPAVSVQTRVVPLQSASPRKPTPPPTEPPPTLRQRLTSHLEARWQPLFWIGVGMAITLVTILAALFSLGYV